MEQLPVNKKEVRESVEEQLDSKDIELTPKESEVVEEMFRTFPDRVSDLSFARWCKYFVSDLMKKLPEERRGNAEKVKNSVGKEIRYQIEQEEFEKMRNLVEQKQPSTFSVNWIKKNNRDFLKLARRGYKTVDGEIDWRFIMEKLGMLDEFKYPPSDQLENRSEEYAEKLLSSLNEKEPKLFSPGWIKNNNKNLYATIFRRPIRDEEGELDWDTIINKLPKKWQKRWESQRSLSKERVAFELKKMLKKEEPEHFSPRWIQNHDSSLAKYVTRHIRDEKDEVDWGAVIGLLPPHLQEKWEKRKTAWSIDDMREELIGVLQKESPDKFNATWLDKHHKGLRIQIGREVRKGNFNSWKDAINKLLPPELADKFGQENRQLDENYKSILLGHLTDTQPDSFSPIWIKRQDDSLYNKIINKFRDGDEIDWDTFASKLPKKWQERWSHEPKWNTESAIQAIKETLENNEPDTFNPAWLREHETATHYLEQAVRTSDGQIDWESIISKLPAKWQERWERQRDFSGGLEAITDYLERLLEEKNPETLHPYWIKQNDGSLYNHIIHNFRSKDQVDWKTVIDQLPEKWQERWKIFSVVPEPEEIIADLHQILEDREPDFFHPMWIKENNQSVYRYLRKFFRQTEGEGVDWEEIIDRLPPKWADRWARQRTYTEAMPEEPYSDTKEVEDTLGDLEEKLYTFYDLIEPEDKSAQKKIIDRLIDLTQAGNLEAEQMLVENTAYLAMDWIENHSELESLRHRTADLNEIIRRAAYRYNPDHPKYDESSFLSYLYSLLKYEAKYKTETTSSLDQSVGNEQDGSMHEGLGIDEKDNLYVFGKKQHMKRS